MTIQSELVDEAAAALLQRIGERVRHARTRAGLARRVLSDRSGVSQRYLAQLEAGEGNISILLLFRVAQALGLRVESLVGENTADLEDLDRLIALYETAAPAERSAALRALTPSNREFRICLIGLRGAGKSTLGQAMARIVGLPFLELTAEIERDCGIPAGEIMALYGPDGYRTFEAEALARIANSTDRVVLAASGGVVANPETYSMLLSRFHTVWLKASAEEHMDRVRAQGDTRPMAGNPAAMAQLKSLLVHRAPLYAQAGADLDTSGSTFGASLEALVALLRDRGWTGEN